MNLELLKIFHIVALAGNITKASRVLNTSQSSLSRAIQLLEHQLKVQLFKRNPRGLTLTSDGKKIFQYADKLIHDNEEFLRSFYNNDNEIKGDLKIITTPFLAELELINHLLPFLEKYPQLDLEIKTVSDSFDTEDADVAIRSFIPYRPDLEQRPLFTHHHKLWASSQYLERFSVPQTPQDLDHHRLLVFSLDKQKSILYGDWLTWLLYAGSTSGRPRKPFLQFTSQSGLLNAACKGYGILQFPQEWIHLRKAELVQILPQLEGPQIEVFYVFNKRNTSAQKIDALYKHLQASLKQKFSL
ncbi:MAG: hypothetical protein BGO77_05355 [Caedibacter sp. 37-49]|nr:MAG: hypothetical protein BGO77_05355 [Caedibacter sp. 37-49]